MLKYPQEGRETERERESEKGEGKSTLIEYLGRVYLLTHQVVIDLFQLLICC